MSGPIKPSDITKAKVESIPDAVWDAFNELIAEKIDRSGRATIKQSDVVDRIMKKMPELDRGDIFKKGWLDVESAYTNVGWTVSYDKPGFCESYPPSFTFIKRP